MSLKKDHLAKNDFSSHRKIKKSSKRISSHNMRNDLKKKTLKEQNECR